MQSNPSLHVASEGAIQHMTALELRPAFKRKTTWFSQLWSGSTGGGSPPRWWEPDLTVPGDALTLFSFENAYYVPSMGAVLSPTGQLVLSSAIHTNYIDPKLEKLQNIWENRTRAQRIHDGIVTMNWGSQSNYGHFVLDTLTSVAAIAGDTTIMQPNFVTPSLRDWQRQHFKILQVQPLELPEPIYVFDKISFSSGMKGSLHNPNTHFQTLRDAQTATLPLSYGRPTRIYVSRRKQNNRRLVNEVELEQAMHSAGFEIVYPETVSVAEQIQMFSAAKIIVAPTGAGLANLLYACNATVFEIIPRDMTLSETAHKWVAYLTAMSGGDWRPFFCEDTQDSEQPEIKGLRRPGYRNFQVSVADLKAFVQPTLT